MTDDVQEFGFLFLSLRCSRRGRHYIIRYKVICGGLFNRGSKVGGVVAITLPEFWRGWGFNPHPLVLGDFSLIVHIRSFLIA